MVWSKVLFKIYFKKRIFFGFHNNDIIYSRLLGYKKKL